MKRNVADQQRFCVDMRYYHGLTNALAALALPALALAQRLVGEDPAAHALRLTLLAQLWLGDPCVLLEEVLAGQGSRAADVHAPGAHALEWVLLGKHVEVPQRKGRCEQDVACLWVGARDGQADRGRGLEVAVDGNTGLRVDSGGVDGCSVRGAAAAHAEKLNLRHDEAVAAAVLAHDAVQMGEPLEVEDLLGR